MITTFRNIFEIISKGYSSQTSESLILQHPQISTIYIPNKITSKEDSSLNFFENVKNSVDFVKYFLERSLAYIYENCNGLNFKTNEFYIENW